MIYTDTAEATVARGRYVAQVRQLVDDQLAILFTMVTAGAAQASTGIQHIEVTRQARSLTASDGARTAVFIIEAITDRPRDLGVHARFRVGQARCILPPLDGIGVPWELVLQRVGTESIGAGYAWMDAAARKPLTATAVAATLRSCFP